MRLSTTPLTTVTVLLALHLTTVTAQPADCHRAAGVSEVPLNGTTKCFTGFIKGTAEVASMIQSFCRIACESKLPINSSIPAMTAEWWIKKEEDGGEDADPPALDRTKCVSAFGKIRDGCKVSWGIGPTGGNFTYDGIVYGVRYMSGQGIVKEW